MIRLTQTADGWTVEDAGVRVELRMLDWVPRADYEALLHSSISTALAEEMIAEAVGKATETERVRCLKWASKWLPAEPYNAIRDGTEAPK